MRKISIEKISEVLGHRFVLNLSVRQSGKSASVSKSVASRYCIRFKELNVSIEEFLSLNTKGNTSYYR